MVEIGRGLLMCCNRLLYCMAGVSNSWASGGHIAHMSNRAEGRMKFSIGRSPLLWATISVM